MTSPIGGYGVRLIRLCQRTKQFSPLAIVEGTRWIILVLCSYTVVILCLELRCIRNVCRGSTVFVVQAWAIALHHFEQRCQTCEIHIAYLLALIHSICDSILQYELCITHANKPTALSRFKNIIFRYRYVLRRNIGFVETEQLYLWSGLYFNHLNVMFIIPSNV